MRSLLAFALLAKIFRDTLQLFVDMRELGLVFAQALLGGGPQALRLLDVAQDRVFALGETVSERLTSVADGEKDENAEVDDRREKGRGHPGRAKPEARLGALLLGDEAVDPVDVAGRALSRRARAPPRLVLAALVLGLGLVPRRAAAKRPDREDRQDRDGGASAA